MKTIVLAIALGILLLILLAAYFSFSKPNNWIKTAPYPIPIIFQSCVTNNNYIYCVGGQENSGINPGTNKTFYAQINSNGSISKWISTTPFPVNTSEVDCVASGDYIYCVGSYLTSPFIANQLSYSNYSLHNAAYYAPISSMGIGEWIQTAVYSTPYSSYAAGGCFGYSNHIFCINAGGIAGSPALNYYAQVSGDGITQWKNTTTDTQTSGYSPSLKCASVMNYIYCFGEEGHKGYSNIAFSIQMSETGLGTWKNSTLCPASQPIESCTASNNTIYCIGSSGDVWGATASLGGNLSEWMQKATYPIGNYNVDSCTSSNNYTYCIGGYGYYDIPVSNYTYYLRN